MTLQIQIEHFQPIDQKTFHLTVEISQSQEEAFHRPLRSASDIYLGRVGEKGAELVRKVMAIPGVTVIRIKPYSISVLKDSSLFKWEDIEPVVEKSFRVIFGGEREDVKYLSLAEIPITVILIEPFKRLGWLIRKAWYRIPNLAQ